jgi:hypothetical protein
MADPVSRARAQLHHARELRQEQAAEFWQRMIVEGRQQLAASKQMTAGDKPVQKPRTPRQKRAS